MYNLFRIKITVTENGVVYDMIEYTVKESKTKYILTTINEPQEQYSKSIKKELLYKPRIIEDKPNEVACIIYCEQHQMSEAKEEILTTCKERITQNYSQAYKLYNVLQS